MGFITMQDGAAVFYKDWGTGQQIVLSHGWPLNAGSWEAQMLFLASHGYRCIAQDRGRDGAGGCARPTGRHSSPDDGSATCARCER
jgi:hypothetical protein